MTRKTRSHLAMLFAVTLLIMFKGQACAEASSDEGMDSAAYRISSVQWEKGVDEYLLRVKGDSVPTYGEPFELFDPLRIVLEIADGSISDSVALPIKPGSGPVDTVRAEMIEDQEPAIVRLEVFLRSDVSYSIERQEYDIVVRFAASVDETFSEDPDLIAALVGDRKDGSASEDGGINSSGNMAGKMLSMEDDFAFSGYEKERITVDFFKIDLHNVFRLIGEISGLNIVVDEGVKGSLTLALNDVPWDFALDVVLNLKDLQKMERFNTILILPKDKMIDWPEQTVGRLAFKAEESVQVDEKEGISVQERLSVSPEEVEAKKLVRQANDKLAEKEYNDAFSLLEKAFVIWPESGRLANRIASLCLVHLGLNSKAIYYAKQVLRLDPHDSFASLQAAIGHANMQNKDEASKYFSQATRGERPSAAALLSYAAFVEQNGDNEGALALLNINGEVHGDTVDTMVSKARLFDKMGESAKAAEQYSAILLSGFRVPADLKRYIEGRVAIAQ